MHWLSVLLITNPSWHATHVVADEHEAHAAPHDWHPDVPPTNQKPLSHCWQSTAADDVQEEQLALQAAQNEEPPDVK